MTDGHAHADDSAKDLKGPIAWMAKNSVAANLLLVVVLVGGLIGAFKIKQELFPEFDLDTVQVTVAYPGASPTEVEQGIVLAIEEEVRGLDGVKHVTSSSREGSGSVSIELLLGANPDKALADVTSAVDRIRTFPEEAEEPTVSLVVARREVISLIIAGEQDLRTLHAIAERARTDLLQRPEITQVEMTGVPPLEVAIEIPRETLEAYGLTLSEVATQVSQASLELPGGKIETAAGHLLVRVSDRRLTGHEFEGIILRSTADGAQLRLGDIATVRDGYEDNDQASYYNGLPAVRLTVYRVGEETPSSVAAAVREYAEELRPQLPKNIVVDVWRDDSEVLRSRIDLLVNNARLGLILVLVCLALLLRARIAFWVALGIPASFLGAFLVMPALGLSINMMTLFALIVTLGMVVDDAIVVGENAFTKMRAGMPRMRAAILGAREMAMPVTFSVLTTIAAFVPLMFVPGTMGKIFGFIPLVVVAVMTFSLLEAFVVLPSHLGHGHDRRPGRLFDFLERQRLKVADGLERFIEWGYRPALVFVLRYRHLFVALAVAVLVVTSAFVAAGLIPFTFFPKLEGDRVDVEATLPFGAPIERTREVQKALEEAVEKAIDELGGPQYVRGRFTNVGAEVGGRWGGGETGSHLTGVQVSLVQSDERPFSSKQFAAAWAKHLPPLTGLDSLIFDATTGPHGGAAVDVQLSHEDNATLAAASGELVESLRSYPEITDIANSFAAGTPQLDFKLLPQARVLGLTAGEVARQLRSAYYGAEAIREQRGRNEVKVMVRLPERQRTSEYDLRQLRIRTPAGGLVPLEYVARFSRGRAPTDIQREDGRRIVDVTGELAEGATSVRPVLESLQRSEIPALEARHPGLAAQLVGEQRSQKETFDSLIQNFALALVVMFGLLAVPLRSYVQPLIIMTTIPFGIIGAVLGHVMMGYGLSIISVFGIVALSGVVVNAALVLIDAANHAGEGGLGPRDAIVDAGARRFRPILLTSITTFFGLAPMIFESSLQARFLIPMAISLGFGVLLSMPIALFVVPSIYLIVEDFRRVFRRLSTRVSETSTPPANGAGGAA